MIDVAPAGNVNGAARLGGVAMALAAATLVALVLALLGPAAAGAQERCAGAHLTVGQQGVANAEHAVLCMTNVERTVRGRPALFRERTLEVAARLHAVDMVRHRYFSHTGQDGSSPAERIGRAGYPPQGQLRATGENIASAQGPLGAPRSIVQGWMESPGHRANILRRTFQEIGVGAARGYYEGGDGGTYVQNFGARQPALTSGITGLEAVPAQAAIRRAARVGRQLSVAATVDRRLAGQRVELLVGAGGRLLGRAGLWVGERGEVSARGALPARAGRARSLLVAVRTPAGEALRRETQIARTAGRSSALRATSGGRSATHVTVRGRVRSELAGSILLAVRYLDSRGRARTARATAQRLGGRWQARVPVPADAYQGVVSIATRGDLRHHGQGISAALPG